MKDSYVCLLLCAALLAAVAVLIIGVKAGRSDIIGSALGVIILLINGIIATIPKPPKNDKQP